MPAYVPAHVALPSGTPSPRAYRCPVCKALPGEPCTSTDPHKVEHSHQPRQDVMIRAQWTPPPLAVWLSWQTERQDPVGNLARDVAEDVRRGCLSARVRGTNGLHRHLASKHGQDVAPAALAALQRAEAEHVEALVAEASRSPR